LAVKFNLQSLIISPYVVVHRWDIAVVSVCSMQWRWVAMWRNNIRTTFECGRVLPGTLLTRRLSSRTLYLKSTGKLSMNLMLSVHLLLLCLLLFYLLWDGKMSIWAGDDAVLNKF